MYLKIQSSTFYIVLKFVKHPHGISFSHSPCLSLLWFSSWFYFCNTNFLLFNLTLLGNAVSKKDPLCCVLTLHHNHTYHGVSGKEIIFFVIIDVFETKSTVEENTSSHSDRKKDCSLVILWGWCKVILEIPLWNRGEYTCFFF